MAHIPRAKNVTQSIRSVERELKLAIKEINQQAAKRLGRGDYPRAQAFINLAQSISEFNRDVKALQSKWREVRTGDRKSKVAKQDQTPLWEYYRPILQSLVALGGEALRKDLETELESRLDGWLKTGDTATNSRGIPRWRIMVRRARKPMVAEGFLSDRNKLKWTITKKGEQAATK